MLIKYHIRSTITGLWLVVPVSGWREKCKPEWADIREAAYQFSPSAAADQCNYLWWNVTERCKRARVPAPFKPMKPVMPFPISAMHIPFINQMVQGMYAWSAMQHNDPSLPTTQEEMDFYSAYMGYSL